METHGNDRLLHSMGPDLTGFDAAAMSKDATTRLKHFTGFEKIAFVLGAGWMNHTVNAFGFMIPCPVKVFSARQIAEASDWAKS